MKELTNEWGPYYQVNWTILYQLVLNLQASDYETKVLQNESLDWLLWLANNEKGKLCAIQ